MTRLRRFLFLSLLCALVATGCDDVISDPNFHTWCGDQLCSWKLESGEIRKVPTWHKKDFGVELLDSNAPDHVTAISQTVYKNPTCLEFSVIADVAPEAQVSVEVDFGADGTVEHPQQIIAVGFREQKTQVTAPLNYSGIKFTITKKGKGRAVLAQMDVRAKTDCIGAPVTLKPQALGTACPLLGGSTTGIQWDGTACVSGVCCEGWCSECCVSANPPRDKDGGPAPDPENKCSDGATCGRLPFETIVTGEVHSGVAAFAYGANMIPRQCDPGKRKRPAGAECLLPADCTSGVCEDARWTVVNTEVDGGRACPLPPVIDPDCAVSSVHGGRCR